MPDKPGSSKLVDRVEHHLDAIASGAAKTLAGDGDDLVIGDANILGAALATIQVGASPTGRPTKYWQDLGKAVDDLFQSLDGGTGTNGLERGRSQKSDLVTAVRALLPNASGAFVQVGRPLTPFGVNTTVAKEDKNGEMAQLEMPVILLSLQQSENVYLAEDGSWEGKYVPAFIRRYPFVLSQTDEQDKAFLCIDESYPGFNQNQEGSSLINEDGSASEYTDGILRFLSQFQAEYQRTKLISKRLRELNLLEPKQAEAKLSDGKRRRSTVFPPSNALEC